MAENTPQDPNAGTLLLKESDFVAVVAEDGTELAAVPKHWGSDELPAGAKKKGRRSSSTSTPTDAEPAGNASTEVWAAYARTKGAQDADLVDDQGEPLGRDELRAKYGTPTA